MLDPRSLRLDPRVVLVSDDGQVASYRLDEVGNPFGDVWRVVVVGSYAAVVTTAPLPLPSKT